MIILGLDPGSRKIGFGVVRLINRKIQYIDSGVINLERKEKLDFYQRMSLLIPEIKQIFLTHSIEQVAMESLIYVKSPTSLIKLAQARGIILSCFLDQYLGRFYEYSPNVIKSSTTGYGHAEKNQIQKFLNMILGTRDYATDDESDALAVAVCHALHQQNKPRLKENVL